MGRREWWAVSALGLGTFTLTTTEILPIGLLGPMASDLGVSEGLIGLTVTFFAVLAAIGAPTLASFTRHVDRRRVLMAVMAVFVIGNLATAFAHNYVMLLVVRAVIGCALGLMWAIVAATAVLMVAPRYSVRATTISFSGVSIASAIGVPLGTLVGQQFGWRIAFGSLAVLSAVTLAALAVFMRPTRPAGSVGLTELPKTLRIKDFRITLVVTALVVTGAYAAYTYVTPFITDSIGLDDRWISPVLLAMGIAGVLGNIASGYFVGRTPSIRRSVAVTVGVLALSLAALLLLRGVGPAAIAMLMLWSVGYAAIPVALQTTVFRTAPTERESATTLYSTTFNISIAIGAAVGAIAIGVGGAVGPVLIGAVLCMIALLATRLLPVGQPG